MSNNSPLFVGISCSVLAGLLLGPQEQVMSQEAATGVLEEIIVTARRREESLMETPVSITAYTNAELASRQISQIHQVAESTPGLVFVVGGGSGQTLGATMYIRGVGARDLLPILQPGVGLYIDGAYIAQTSAGLTNMVDIESVEVLRGPQGTLFGRNTVGGAILVNSVKPSDEFEGDVDLTLGEYDRQEIKATVNVPFTDNFFGRFTVMNRDKDGYIDTINIPDDDGLGSDDTTAFRAALRWMTDSLTVDWTTDFTDHQSDGKAEMLTSMIRENDPNTDAWAHNNITSPLQGDVPILNATSFFPLDTYRNARGFNPQSDWEIFGTSLQVEWELTDNLTFNSITTYRDADGTGGDDNDQSPATVFHSYNFYESEQFTQEFRLSGTAVDDRLQWTSGLYWFEEEAFNIDDVDFPFFEARSGSFVDNTSFAVFGQFTYEISDKVSLTLGARYTDEKFDDIVDDRVQFATAIFNPGAPMVNPVLPPGYLFPVVWPQAYFPPKPDAGAFVLVPNQTFETDSDEFDPYLSIAYNFTDTLMGYFSYSEAFKGGGFTQRIGPGNQVNAFQPEFAEVYEIGAKWSGERVRLTAALFFNDYTDLQVSTDRQIGGTRENAASAEIKGGEFELFAAATDRLQFSLGLGYLDGKYVELNPNVAFPLGLDAALPNVMDWQRNASIIYSAPVANGEIIARADYSYVDGHFTEADNIPEAFVEDYSVTNVGLTYVHGSDRWEVSLQGRNVGDEVYFTDSGSNPNTDGWTEGPVAPPSEYSVRFKYRF
jgi:iron complex outermembrane receptor protein